MTWVGWGVALAASLGVVAAVLAPPFVGEATRSVIMHAFAGACHQLPERSLHLGGVPLAVCDRCLGIYSGLALGVLVVPVHLPWADRLHRVAGPVLALALVPLGLDWLGPVVDLWGNSPLSRILTGGLVGGVAGMLVGRAAARFGRQRAEPTETAGSAASVRANE